MRSDTPRPGPHNTLHLNELLIAVAPTVLLLMAAHQFLATSAPTMMLVDALIVASVPLLTWRILRPHLRATKARKLEKDQSNV